MVQTRLFFIVTFSLVLGAFAGNSVFAADDSAFEFGTAGTVIRLESIVNTLELTNVDEEVNVLPLASTDETTVAVVSSTFVQLPQDDMSQLVARIVNLDNDAQMFMTEIERNEKKAVVVNTLRQFPNEFYGSLQSITLKGSVQKSRGLANKDIMILQIKDLSDEEVASVMVHELGHVVDGGYLSGTSSAESAFQDGKQMVATDDPSVDFYSLSWVNENSKRTSDANEFVSGYAKSNPYEDFAETFAYYVLHGAEFRTLSSTNDVLASKYAFMKNSVFHGKEYGMTIKNIATQNTIPWDVTKLSYSLETAFAS